jgi:phosphatidate cytidylyltransferase
VRLATGLIGAPLILLLLYLAPPWAWLIFVSVCTAVAALELFAMTHPLDRVSQVAGMILTLSVVGVIWTWGTRAAVVLSLLLLLPLVSMFLVLWRLGNVQTAALRMAAGAFGPLWLGGGLSSIILLRRDGGVGHDGASFVVLALVLSWLSDTGAFFVGRSFGRHKLYEAVSPKKTVEGALGGLAGGLFGALAVRALVLPSLPLPHAVGLAIVAGALGQLGDLGESLLKRSVGVKDSGNILPGHGGILDRADALLVTSTITYLYVMWTRH